MISTTQLLGTAAAIAVVQPADGPVQRRRGLRTLVDKLRGRKLQQASPAPTYAPTMFTESPTQESYSPTATRDVIEGGSITFGGLELAGGLPVPPELVGVFEQAVARAAGDEKLDVRAVSFTVDTSRRLLDEDGRRLLTGNVLMIYQLLLNGGVAPNGKTPPRSWSRCATPGPRSTTRTSPRSRRRRA